MIVHNAICGKASESWILWEGVSKLIASLRVDITQQPKRELAVSPINKLEQFGLLSSAEAPKGEDLRNAQQRRSHLVAQGFWSILQFTSMLWLILRSLVTALMHASSIPARSTRRGTRKRSDKLHVSAVDPASRPGRPSPQDPFFPGYDKRPVIRMAVWTCISRLTSLEQRMPWLSGILSLLQWLSLYGPGKVCSTNGALDR